MEKEIGAEGNIKIEIVDGNLQFSGGYEGKGGGAKVVLYANSEYFVDELAKLIPGDTALENISLAALKQTLKSLKV